MVICFLDEKRCITGIYPILSINIETDGWGIPCNICIKADPLILEEIADKYCILGYNCMPELDHEGRPSGDLIALYGRLQDFIIRAKDIEPELPHEIDW